MERKICAIRGMVISCSCGSIDNFINTDYGHGVLYNNHPVLNANDITWKVNLIGFGDCSQADYVFERIQERTKYSTGEVILTDVQRCRPEVTKPWIGCNEKHIIDGSPCLIIGSCCTCTHGGTIEILNFVPEQ